MYGSCVLVLLFSLLGVSYCDSYTPVVIWHGIADSCCGKTLAGRIQQDLKDYLPGIHVVSLRIGNNAVEDYLNSFFKHPNDQVEAACNIIKSDPLLANGYNAIGHSQGSQFLRGVAQRCPEPPMKNLISLAGQHQGVYGIPFCNTIIICNILRKIGSDLAYTREAQEIFTPAAYWHDPRDVNLYVANNTFLADINNENTVNQTYIENLQRLENFVMVRFEEDDIVKPIETHWFGFYRPKQSLRTETLQESELYSSDRLGLKQMDRDGKLHFLSVAWKHSQVEWPWLRDNIVDRFLISKE